ncbi:MAG: ABC transporter ATP-binding protein [Anaerovoracaceae bacterium]
MEILRAEHICRTFGEGEGAVEALRDISFSIEKGQFVAIIGPSGSGKSTLMHIMGGVDRPTSGKILIDGMDLYSQTRDELSVFRRRQVGLVYQFFNLIPILNVEENLVLPVLLDGRRVNEDRKRELLEILGLTEKAKAYPVQLSGGQQQRVSIGRALINTPALLLADEPTGNLDSRNSQEVLELLKQSNRNYEQTVIVITHDENIALQADRIITIEDGKITNDEVIRR